ncbi:two-component regulator propeller domain-containing protein [Flavobacterium sp. N1736]|uniref:hybrid sensor histidine kinase/response regulator transcription factor n=1 Tax=Flavobacterium sp. N1736 TaxID=2986823 RepID=UPI0022245424|nr:two-component regulator propeller domain-containing protein [Flavobacterium sp. N1736]
MQLKFKIICVAFITLLACSNKNNPDAAQSVIAGPQTEFLPEIKDVKYAFEQLDNSKGLSNSSINTIFQDSENLIWIGTWDGLNRYDGNNFRIFRPELNNKNSLSNQVILKIDEDYKGLIWIATLHGINSYNKQTDIFQHYYFDRENIPPLSESEFHITLNPSKKVFCAVKDWGIGYFNGTDFQLLNAKDLSKKEVRKMEFTSNGDLLILFEDNKLYSLAFRKSQDDDKEIISKIELISENISQFGILSKQKIVTLSVSGITTINSVLYKETSILSNNITKFITSISDGIIVSSKSKYSIIDTTGNIVDKPWLNSLNNQKITTLIAGNENIIWAGTDGDGIIKMFPANKPFNLVSRTQIPEFDGGIIRTFLAIEGNSFWIGTKGKGLFRLPHDFYSNPEKQLQYMNFNDENSIVNNAVYSLYKGKENLIFIGTDGDGITLYDLNNSKLINWAAISGSKECDYFKSVYSVYQDEDGFYWFGTNGYGMIRCKIERSGEKLIITNFKKYIADSNSKNALSSNKIYAIIPKNKKQLWIGTRLGGLNLFDKDSEQFITYKNDRNNPKSLSSNDILCLQTDAQNQLWIGTSFGLNVLEDLKEDGTATFKNFTVANGLPNNTIHGIIADQNKLWLSTNFGLSNFDTQQLKFTNYTKNEGLQNNEFSDGAFYQQNQKGFIFMGGIKGFNYFLPEKIKESVTIPPLFIDKISGQNQSVPYYQGLALSQNSKKNPAIVLNHDQNFFDIELTALTYINTEKCQYAYQLMHFDKGWNTINNRRIISFTNVPKGKYALWLKWTNSDGVWSKPVHAIDICIKPIIWQSNLAFAIYFLLAVAFVLFVVSYYKKRQSLNLNILSAIREKELHENRLSFFTDIAHEFQTPLTLIVGPVQKLSNEANGNEKNQKFIEMIQRNSSRLLFLTQQLLEFRKAEYNGLEVKAKKFDLVSLIEQIAELFDELALDKNISYHLEIPTALTGWFDQDKVEKIVFNLLSNAFKYTPENGRIDLKFYIENKELPQLNIIITNTGKGIPKQELSSLFNPFFLGGTGKESDNNMFRTGIGLAYVKKLVHVLKGDIQVSSSIKKTNFTILLPCSKDVFTAKELDLGMSPVLISEHLKNILEQKADRSEIMPNKILSLNECSENRKVILIVEDELDIHLLLHELLNEKYKLLTAYNGREALEIVRNEMPDLIISDVMMPFMDGVELCKKIKTNLKTGHIPFIMLTAKNSVLHRIDGIESGANSYIPKPFYPDHLLVRIQKLLEEKELLSRYITQDNLVQNLSVLSVISEEKDFIKKVIDLIRNNIDNENLQSLFLEKELGISNSQLYRKIKQNFNLSPGDLIRTVRLKYAAELLRKNILTVSEVCYKSGFNNRSYFYREFKKLYNTTPKNYQLIYKNKR